MKRMMSILLAVVLAFSLVACGGSTGSAAPAEPKDYKQIIVDARTAEQNEAFTVVAYDGETYSAVGAGGDDMSAEDLAGFGGMLLEILGLTAEDVDSFALSVSMMNVHSYGVAIMKPAEGKTEAVTAGLQNFIDLQISSQEFYLRDQYEIAKAAKLQTMPSGEVVMVMCENADDVFASIEAALK